VIFDFALLIKNKDLRYRDMCLQGQLVLRDRVSLPFTRLIQTRTICQRLTRGKFGICGIIASRWWQYHCGLNILILLRSMLNIFLYLFPFWLFMLECCWLGNRKIFWSVNVIP